MATWWPSGGSVGQDGDGHGHLRRRGCVSSAAQCHECLRNSGTADTVNALLAIVVIYDPSAGFVTGGGWINSPAGRGGVDATLTGKANFGFVSRYKKGQTVPTGETEFVFKRGT